MTPEPQRKSNAGKRAILAAWRRIQVLRLTKDGMETPDIAMRLGVSRDHVTAILTAAKKAGGL